MKKYDIFYAGAEKVTTIQATCISKACKNFMETLKNSAKYELRSKAYASIRYADNFSVCSDFVVVEK